MSDAEGHELTRLSAVELGRLIRAREVSPVEVVEAYLRRIESLNPTLNAVVTLAPDALEHARAKSVHRLRTRAEVEQFLQSVAALKRQDEEKCQKS